MLLLSHIPLSFWQRGTPTQGLVTVEGQRERRPSQWLRPTALAILLLAVRTALEDRMLREELDGYSDYAQRGRDAREEFTPLVAINKGIKGKGLLTHEEARKT